MGLGLRYVSTRGSAPELGFGDVLLTGLANDGGLYVPAETPSIDWARFSAASNQSGEAEGSYVDVAVEVMAPFVVPSFDLDEFRDIVGQAYATFHHDEVVPVVDLGDDSFLMELFWGPTLAFKDVALQLVGRLFEAELTRRGQRLTIVGATSGDTGSAAIEACRDRDALDIFILFPKGRVSEVQRRQMTTVRAGNVHAIEVDGTFDDCQDLVKAMFAHESFRDEVHLGAVNSINWARVMAQVVYYAWAARNIGRGGPVSFSVPTGNFGNVYAGEIARRMGVPISQLLVGSNRNDILTQFFGSGRMTISDVEPSLSPSMDIQVSSNLERLLFDLLARDGGRVADFMAMFRGDGTAAIDSDALHSLSENWRGTSVDDQETLATIARYHETRDMLLDPHTAVGMLAAERLGADLAHPVITLATAHPAKFPDAVSEAVGIKPDLPSHLSDLMTLEENFATLPDDLAVVEAYVLENRSG